MNVSTQILSDIIVYMKYARYLPDKKRRETWKEIVDRNKNMHLKRFPKLKDEIEEAYKYVYDKKVLPSMRAMQFSGKPIERNPNRQYNCSAIAVTKPEVFKEIMFLLLAGCGVGYSVQRHHVAQLSEIIKPTKTRRFLIGDSIEGWSDAVGALVNAYFGGRKSRPEFDYSDIRPQGTPLKTSGGKAPGPAPLKTCLHNIQTMLDRKTDGEKLRPIEVHDIICHIADAVLSGGVRRSSCIAIFSFADTEMLECKFGKWYETNPQRARANNSAMILRHRITEEEFYSYWEKIKESGSGEPGIYWSNSKEILPNPCQAGWAKVLTKKGIRKLKDIMVGQEIWSKEGWTKVIDKQCTGKKEVFKYSTTAGVFYGTENHQLVSNGEKIEAKDCDSIDIFTGPVPAQKEINDIDPQAVVDGLLIGDGGVRHNKIVLYINSKDQDYFGSEVCQFIGRNHPKHSCWDVLTQLKISDILLTYKRKIPGKYLYSSDKNVIRSFLRGIFSANGSVCDKRVTLKASSLQIIEDTQLLLSSLGIRSYYTTNKAVNVQFRNGNYRCKQSYDLNVSVDREKFYYLIGFIQKYKMEKLLAVCDSVSRKQRHVKSTYDIKSVDFVAVEKVYDITVDNESHTYWTQNCDVSNCAEISLKASGGLCNLTEINASNLDSQEEFNKRAKVAAFIGSLQASYTDFHYLREIWKENADKEALLGVSVTGIASGGVLKLDMKEAAKVVVAENRRVANLIGINEALRMTTVKPSGTSSLVLGCSSGIHSWHAPHYIRRLRVNKDEPIYSYLVKNHPELIEDDFFKSTDAVISVPIKAPEGALFRNETALKFLERIKKVYNQWIKPGHIKGDNTHNISCTVSIKPNEWERVGKWMWENRNNYNAISVLPYDDHVYKQAPFEEITEEEYNAYSQVINKIDLTKIVEEKDSTTLRDEVACSNGQCEIV